MNDQRMKNILKAVRCCRDDLCSKCPMQLEICDELRVEMESLPARLVDLVEEAMDETLKGRGGKDGRH